MKIDPWSSAQFQDYAKLRDEFGISEFNAEKLPSPPKLFRRGVVFGQRGFELIEDAILNKKKFAVLSGLMPSGNMHIGHKMVIDQINYFAELGGVVFVAIADIEAYATRNISIEKAREIAIEQYVVNYIALGLKQCQIYFQTKRKEVKDLAWFLAKKINWSEMKAIYGFDNSTSMAHVHSPLIQVGDILHVQLAKFCSPCPTIVPVGVDQDPHIRLTRGVVNSFRLYNATLTKDNKIGVFVKGDENVSELLNLAEKKLKEIGFNELEKIPSYKALYVLKAKTEDIQKIDEQLIEIEFQFNKGMQTTFYQPSSTYHRFMTGLAGDKMSSSKPESSIFLTDLPFEVKEKIKKCKTGGAISLEEQRKYGGKPEECVVYEIFLYHLIEKDEELNEIFVRCKRGELLCGECKKYCSQLMEKWLKEFKEKREAAKEKVKEYLRGD